MQAEVTDVSVTVVRYSGEYQVTGKYNGYEYGKLVSVLKTMTLHANNVQQLENMVNVAAVDGWRRNGES